MLQLLVEVVSHDSPFSPTENLLIFLREENMSPTDVLEFISHQVQSAELAMRDRGNHSPVISGGPRVP